MLETACAKNVDILREDNVKNATNVVNSKKPHLRL